MARPGILLKAADAVAEPLDGDVPDLFNLVVEYAQRIQLSCEAAQKLGTTA